MGNYAYHTKGRENEKHYFDIQSYGTRLQDGFGSCKILERREMKKFLRAMEWEKRGGGMDWPEVAADIAVVGCVAAVIYAICLAVAP